MEKSPSPVVPVCQWTILNVLAPFENETQLGTTGILITPLHDGFNCTIFTLQSKRVVFYLWIMCPQQGFIHICVAYYKRDVTPGHYQWSSISFALSHWHIIGDTVETLYNTINFCWNNHKRHSIARPKGRGMGCLLWVQRATYCVALSILSSIKYLL